MVIPQPVYEIIKDIINVATTPRPSHTSRSPSTIPSIPETILTEILTNAITTCTQVSHTSSPDRQQAVFSEHFQNTVHSDIMQKAPDLTKSYFVQGLQNMHKYFNTETGKDSKAPPTSPSDNITDAEKELEQIILTNEKGAVRSRDLLPEPLTTRDRYGFYTSGSNQEDVLNNIRERRNALIGKDGQILGFDFPLLLALYWLFDRKQTKITSMTTEVQRIINSTGFSKEAAARFMSFFPLQFNDVACRLLATHRRMRCFDLMYFVNSGSVKYNGDLLVRLLWGDKYLSAEPALGRICLRFTENARQVLGILLLQLGGVIATSFGRLRQVRSLDEDPYTPTYQDALHVLRCFPAPAYNTRQMGEQASGFNRDYCDGFNLVSEVVKVSMSELEIYIEEERVQNGATRANAVAEKINAKEVIPFLPQIIASTLEEVYGYLYAVCAGMPGVNDFARFCHEEGNLFIPLFRRRYEITSSTTVVDHEQQLVPVLQEARIRNVLNRIVAGEPVMGAELRRSARGMSPVVQMSSLIQRNNVAYDVNALYTRARFPGTLPYKTYNTAGEGGSGEKDDVPLQFVDGDVEEVRADEHFWLRESLQSFMAKGKPDPSSAIPLTIPNFLQVRNNNPDWIVEDYNLEEPPMPRLLLKGSIKDRLNENQYQPKSTLFTPAEPRSVQVTDDAPPEWENVEDYLQPVPEERPLERYNEDLMDSDHEWEYFDNEARAENPQPLASIGIRLADLYREVLQWDIDPERQQEAGHLYGPFFTNMFWMRQFFANGIGKKLLPCVSQAQDADQYRDHMLACICLTMRANIRRTILSNDELAEFRGDSIRFMDDAYAANTIPMFIRVDVTQLVPATGLFHVRATSTNLEHNRTIVDSLRGFTVCLAFLETLGGAAQSNPNRPSRRRKVVRSSVVRRHHAFSNVFLMLIRKVRITGEDTDRQGRDADPETLHLTMTFSSNRLYYQRFVPQEGQVLHFLPICSLAAELRMFKAIHLIPTLPEAFRNILYGNRHIPIQHDGLNVLTPMTRSTLTRAMVEALPPATAGQVRAMIRNEVDEGSLDYLVRCLHRNDCRVDNSNFNALVQCMRTISNGEPNSSGAFCIQGPPGTGKTTNIVYLLGALLHHSRYGHVWRRPLNYTGADDNVLRASDRADAFKILVVASSNAAVDNALDRIARYGIPDGRGTILHPAMLRIARWDYELPAHLQRYELRTASTRFDRNWRERRTPSLRARRRCAQEAIVFFTTASSAGGSGFKELEQHVDIVIHDEGANSMEPEVLVPLTAATMKNLDVGRERPRRLFYISVGDQRQLPALSHVPMMITEARLTGQLRFVSPIFTRSLFERLIDHNRVGHYFLGTQYRMHPTISRITSPPFYGVYFQNPLPVEHFQTEYNEHRLLRGDPPELLNGPFAPMTFIDTSCIQGRGEIMEPGGNYYNPLEARLIAQLVDTLFEMCIPGMLDSNIAVIAPYARQVRCIEETLINDCRSLRRPAQRRDRDVRVCTVDSMQGSEASVVIFSTTRSNRARHTGFVKDTRRLNVSVSRAKFVNIIVGDISSIDGTGLRDSTKGITTLKKIYDWCAYEREPGARLATAHLRRPNVYNNRYNEPNFTLNFRRLISNSPATSTRNQIGTAASDADLRIMEATPNYVFANLFPAAGAAGPA